MTIRSLLAVLVFPLLVGSADAAERTTKSTQAGHVGWKSSKTSALSGHAAQRLGVLAPHRIAGEPDLPGNRGNSMFAIRIEGPAKIDPKTGHEVVQRTLQRRNSKGPGGGQFAHIAERVMLRTK